MAREKNGEKYLTPSEASQMLQISYKTLQRWAEVGTITVWVGNGIKRKTRMSVHIDFFQTPTGYRFYKQDSIERLRQKIAA